MRLDKYLSDLGAGTRSELKRQIRSGDASVNGKIMKDPGAKVDASDIVTFHGKAFSYSKYVYYLLNKPAGVISATEDAKHKTVLDLLKKEDKRKDLFPVGRLDIDTEGLLLITNDGDLAHRLLAPGKHVDKVYRAIVKGSMDAAAVEAFAAGLVVDKELTAKPAKLSIIRANEMQSEVEITLQEGKFHQIKRMFQAIDSEVLYLERIAMGATKLDEALPRGEYRPLTQTELELLGINHSV